MISKVTPTQARLLDVALSAGRRDITFERDRTLLAAISPIYDRMLRDLADRGVVHRLKNGEYLIADVSAESPEESASWPVLLDLRMQPIGAYYVSYFTGLEQHGLTDHTANEITAAVLGRSAGSGRSLRVAGRRVKMARQSRDDRWFGFHTVYERDGSYELGLKERVLLDALDRPEISGGPETVARAWSRALAEGIDVDLLVDFAGKLSQTVIRRTGLILTLLGRAEHAASLEALIGANTRAVGLFSGRPSETDQVRDSTWRVVFDVPRRTVLGWLAYDQ
jgi:predicted transcriptional regulator of viral defense system